MTKSSRAVGLTIFFLSGGLGLCEEASVPPSVLRPMTVPRPPAGAARAPATRDAAAGSAPKRLRTTEDRIVAPPGSAPPDLAGLAKLRASGSGAFTLDWLRGFVASRKPPVVVFDLRQEPHVYVDGLPVSWYAPRDWINVGAPREAALADEARRLARVRAARTLETRLKNGGDERSLIVREALSEAEAVAGARAGYVRLMVTDHLRPADAEVDRFVAAADALPRNSWVHMHCRGGEGRTTTFLTLYDMLRNAKRVPFRDIVRRQALLNSGYDLLKTPPPGNPERAYRLERADFVRAFYAFARSRDEKSDESWSRWLSRVRLKAAAR